MVESGQPQARARGPLVFAVLLITLGLGWLLTALSVGPGIDWVWTLGLGVLGVMAFVLSGGVDKVSVILGPFLLLCSVLSILRQTGKLSVDVEVPLLVMLSGVLLLLAQLRVVPPPRWMKPVGGKQETNK